MRSRLQHHLRRSHDRLSGEKVSVRSRQTRGDAAVGERLDELEDVRGTRARHSGDGVHEPLRDHDTLAATAHESNDTVEVCGCEHGIRGIVAYACGRRRRADHARRVGHDAHDSRARPPFLILLRLLCEFLLFLFPHLHRLFLLLLLHLHRLFLLLAKLALLLRFHRHDGRVRRSDGCGFGFKLVSRDDAILQETLQLLQLFALLLLLLHPHLRFVVHLVLVVGVRIFIHAVHRVAVVDNRHSHLLRVFLVLLLRRLAERLFDELDGDPRGHRDEQVTARVHHIGDLVQHGGQNVGLDGQEHDVRRLHHLHVGTQDVRPHVLAPGRVARRVGGRRHGDVRCGRDAALYEPPCHRLRHGPGADEPDSRLGIRRGSPRRGRAEPG